MDAKKTQPGQRFQFSASLYNDLIDVVKWAKTQRGLSGASQTGMRSSATTVLVKNESGAAVPQFGCLEVSDKVGSGLDFENLKALRGVKPTASLKPVVIVQATAQSDEVAESVVAGTTMAKVDVKSTSDTHAEPVSASTTLRSGTAGRFRILHPLTSTGVQNVMVRFESAGATAGLPQIKNESGYTVPEWGFLMIDGVVTTPTADLSSFKASPVFRGTAPRPHTVFSNKRIVSVPGGAAPGETVDCILDGRVPARINSPNRTDPLMAHLANESTVQDVTRLGVSNHQTNYGFPILYRESGLGEKWGLIDLMPQNQPAVFSATVVGSTSGFMGGSTNGATPYMYEGNPWQDPGSFLQNGLCRIVPSSTALHFDGATAWMGEIKYGFTISYSNLFPAGASGFYYLPGFRVDMVALTPGFTTARHHAASFSLPPSLIGPSDRTRLSTTPLRHEVSLPLLLQSAVGNLEKNNTSLRVRVTLTPIGDTTTTLNGRVTIGLDHCTLSMHEVDPMLPVYSPAVGIINSGGAMISGGKTTDPLSVGKEGISSAAIFVRGNRGGSSLSTGTGFE